MYNVNHDYGVENSEISDLHSLCIAAGFNETNLIPSREIQIGVKENSQLMDKTLTDRFVGLENEIKYLNEQNISLTGMLKSQKVSHDNISERVKVLEHMLFNFAHSKTSDEDQTKNLNITEKEKKQADVEVHLNNLIADVGGVNKKLEVLGTHWTDISKVVYRTESEVQNFIRRHSLVIENLCPKEDGSAMEMLLIFSMSVLNVKLEDYDIESLQVIEKLSAEQISGTPEKRMLPRPVLVTFTCYKIQTRIYKSWMSFRCKNMLGSLSKERGQGITIKEYLTENQENVYNEALKLKEKHLIIDCWTYKGKTHIKKQDNSISEFSHTNEIVPKTESSSCSVM